VNDPVDPTFAFMPPDGKAGPLGWDARPRSRWPPGPPHRPRDRFDVAFANDPDADARHSSRVTAGCWNPNHHARRSGQERTLSAPEREADVRDQRLPLGR